MAIDIKKMKAKLDALNNKGKAKTAFWRPEEGVNYSIRVVTTPDGDPFKESWFHYEIGKNSILCPKKNNGEDCPICAFANKLYRENTEDSNAMAKKFLPRQRFFSPVVVRGEEKEGIRIWGYGKTVYQDLINLVLNPDYGDITDPENGTDLTIRSSKDPGAQFPKTKLTPARKTSALCPSPSECAELLETLPNFDELHEYRSPAEISKILDEHLSGGTDADAEESSSQTVKYGGATKAKAPKSTDAIDAAFADLTG